jgi:iron complex transport system substrate-binding protein
MTSPFAPLTRRALSRRALLASGGALGAGALLTACGDGPATPSGSEAAGDGDGPGWTFTDDRGRTIRRDRTPERVVAFIGSAAALHDFGIECTAVFGPTVAADGSPDVQAGELDVDGLTVLGNAWGEFNVDQYAGLDPELLVTNMFVENALWYVPDESLQQIEQLADTAAITASPTTLRTAIGRYAELAEALGADVRSTQVTDAKRRFEEASEALRQAARDNPGLTVLACSASADLFYASSPAAMADLSYFAELGVELITPGNLEEGGFYEYLSWENTDRYPADVLLLDNRTSSLQPADLTDRPTWNRLPAVEAGQVLPWFSEPRFSYAGCAPLLEDLAAALRDAKRLS